MPDMLPKDDKLQLFEGETAPPKTTRSREEREKSSQKRKDTIGMDQFEALNTFPKDTNQLRDWAESLSDSNKRNAIELDLELQKRGFKGLLDPKLPPKAKAAVERLFMDSSGHYHEQNKPKHAPPSRKTPKDLLDDKQSENLQDVPQAVSALGGMMMEGEDAA